LVSLYKKVKEEKAMNDLYNRLLPDSNDEDEAM